MDFLQKYFDWLGHIIEAFVMALVIALPIFLFGIDFYTATLLSGMFAVGHFHGREKRDYEVHEHMKPPHLKGYLMWKWSFDNLTDFLPVLAVFAAYAYWVYVL